MDGVADLQLELNTSTVPDPGPVFAVVVAASNHCIFLSLASQFQCKIQPIILQFLNNILAKCTIYIYSSMVKAIKEAGYLFLDVILGFKSN